MNIAELATNLEEQYASLESGDIESVRNLHDEAEYLIQELEKEKKQ